MELQSKLLQTFRDVPNFPKEGILFKDITPLLKSPDLCKDVLSVLAAKAEAFSIDAIVGIESRGFLFGLPLAIKLGVPFIPIRKKGKLPAETLGTSYALEYGHAEIEIHADGLKPGQRVMVHDDVLATGGTAAAAKALIELCSAEVTCYSFLLEIEVLNGREKLEQNASNIVTLAAC